ncbi:MAG: hypothetical protein RMM29_04680 [Planctomycetota bacterium]|nr:hypothetical protein [Planctomycetota bacterium]MDW8372931.1 hypothetical protein [Planctomycetota bacterium]
MRLLGQALMLAAGGLLATGCARLLAPLVAPQQTAATAATRAADASMAPGVERELDRLIAGRVHNRDELLRLKEALEQRRRLWREREGAAQDDPQRLAPWHPRVPLPRRLPPSDLLRLAERDAQRGLAELGPCPDGIPPGELLPPLDVRAWSPNSWVLPRRSPRAAP